MPNKKSKKNKKSISTKSTKPTQQEEMAIIINGEDDNNLQPTPLTAFNVPEKIILVIDRACDEVFSYFELNNGTKYRPLQMLKNAFTIFVHNKNFINKKHEFALMVLNESDVSWVLDFTSDIQKVSEAIDNLEECETEDIFDLNSLFNVIDEKVQYPTLLSDDLVIPPQFIVRVVLSYARSFTMPSFTRTERVNEMLNWPYFFIDVVMTHEIPDTSNKCELIFKKLEGLNIDGKGYLYYVDRNPSKLYYSMGKICGHPYQRSLQKTNL
ncbi:BRISC and BRCA1-A complex member 1-like [Onthophagus taurus]|uniref:BRISC and BRCA1-A complex member 1-like n=1 Tax=Onthophagus taurus TaxID=166361 RepID=UPI000C209EC8|nr:BRISC and BRCA1-A complex member 1-like [Onthophagus taurus]XP_022905094.1 BRISC and BRCA1-A complex member 1-like [Onthophagus taurus]